MEAKLDEVFESFYSRAEINATEIGWEVIREAEQQAKEQILQHILKEVDDVLSDYRDNSLVDGRDIVVAELRNKFNDKYKED